MWDVVAPGGHLAAGRAGPGLTGILTRPFRVHRQVFFASAAGAKSHVRLLKTSRWRRGFKIA